MKLKSVLWLLLPALLAACVKEEYSRTSSYIVNRSGHRVLVTPYLRDSAVLARRITVAPGDSLLVNEGSGSGKEGASSWVSQAQSYDSLHVLFVDTTRTLPPDTARIGHTRRNLAVPYAHVVPFSSPRSLLNEANWTRSTTEETRYLLRSNLVFIVTQQDYLDAR